MHSKVMTIANRLAAQGYQDPQSLFDAAVAMLERLSQPFYSYTINGIHAGPLAAAMPGDLIRVVDNEDALDIYTRIVSVSKDDVYGANNTAKIVIANEPTNITGSAADLADRQRIESVYSQGSTSLFSDSFYDNCGPGNQAATLRFFIPENAVHVNEVSECIRSCNQASR